MRNTICKKYILFLKIKNKMNTHNIAFKIFILKCRRYVVMKLVSSGIENIVFYCFIDIFIRFTEPINSLKVPGCSNHLNTKEQRS